MQSQVAADLAAGLRGGLGHDDEARVAAPRTVVPEAYSLYLKGRYCARNLTEQGQRRAIRYFRESIQADPNYAAAHAGLAECFVQLAYFFGMEPKKAFAEASPPR